ncbi:hypothetical protein IGS74_01520 [Aureimonas sp. OT7]|uniref:hypothetical protein n=1 Tax=Aureimonas TaxID=414371 RepID=UPI00178075E6|nr:MULTISPECIES: hypothetical protein [Aureimonas]QOG06999.1 hypothetical protein IGS74_01520 [Aureimonas sp. OT7]
MNRLSALLALSILTAIAGSAQAQDATQRPGCVDLSEQGSETAPARGPDSGTAPGGAGSSGWTGGLGGSDIGTSQQDEQTAGPTPHPPVASGLDPIAGTTNGQGPAMQTQERQPAEGQQQTTSAPC